MTRRPFGVSKYRAIPTVVDGIRFDSRAEAARWLELRLLVRAGQVVRLACHPRYPLAVNGTTIGHYEADFECVMRDGEVIVEDVKGMATLPLAKWKQKHLRAQYGIVVQEIRASQRRTA